MEHGARTEEVRALRWEHVDLTGRPDAEPPIPPSISVLRSVRDGGDTKTRKFRRRFALPRRCVDALITHRARLNRTSDPAALVFPTRAGTEMDAHNVRRAFRAVARAAGLDADAWTPRGHLGSCDTASCPCCRTQECPSSRSPGCSATAAQR